jgi:nicotinate-nucleotide--dimethylbenzimidazole phosphoribosyltransferase
MSDTGNVPAGGLPPVGEQAAHDPFGSEGLQPQGAVRPPYTFLDQPDGPDEEEDELLMPGPQGSWSEPVAQPAGWPAEAVQVAQPQPVQAAVPVEPFEPLLTAAQPAPEPPAPSWPPLTPPAAVPVAAQAAPPVAEQQPAAAPRRPLHAGPPIPDPSMMTGQVPVRSLADRGPSSLGDSALAGVAAAATAQHQGPEYLDPASTEAAAQPLPQQVAEPQPVEAQVLSPEVLSPVAPVPAAEPLPTVPVQTPSPESTLGANAQPLVEAVTEAGALSEPLPEQAPVPVAEALVAAPPAAPQPVAETEPTAEPMAEPAAEPVIPPQHAAPGVGSSRISAFMAAPAPQATAVDPEPVAAVQPEAEVQAQQDPQPEPEVQTEAAADAPAEPQGEAQPELPAEPRQVAEPEAPVAEPEVAAVVEIEVEVAVEAQPQPEATALGTGLLTDPAVVPEPATEAVAEAPVESGTAAEEPVQAEVGAEAEGAAEPEPAEEESEAVADVEPEGPAAPGYEDEMREAVHRVMRERRDIRNGFRSDPVPHDVLLRVLEAAHTAPSVGYSQPWDFVVIRSAKTRARMHQLAERQRDAYAESLPKGRAKQFKELKIEAILETPINIVVTADRTRGGRHTLGRHTQPQMAPYSAALAVENLWLAARAEGLGVGWVSFFDEQEMVRELGLPEHLDVVAYLCVGYVNEFPAEPELAQAGWAKKRPLSWVVHEETYGRRALPGEEPHSVLQETLRGIRPLDAKALGEAWDRQKRMTKPAGSLGMLEIISAQLCGLSRKCPPPIPEPACVAVFAGDHGVHAQGVTPWPQEVTAQMVGNFLAGGAVVNAFAAQLGAEVCVVDVGVASELPPAVESGRTTGLLPRKVRLGTDDMTQGPAMTREEAQRAVEVGIETARDLVAAGNKALITGDMGIANTTAAAALICVFTGEDPSVVTGRGTGIDDETHARKVAVIREALALHRPDPADPIGVLAAVGGLEHAAIAGFLLGAASLRTPVVLDGVIAGAAALVAKAIAPEVLAACIAGHRSAEPGHKAALAKLGLRPLIDLDLRLGEGTGALLALPLVQSAARAMHDVATFDSAGVTDKH